MVQRSTYTHSMPKGPSAPDYLALSLHEDSALDCFVEELVDKGAERVQRTPSAPDY
jgi:hypothetical protein